MGNPAIFHYTRCPNRVAIGIAHSEFRRHRAPLLPGEDAVASEVDGLQDSMARGTQACAGGVEDTVAVRLGSGIACHIFSVHSEVLASDRSGVELRAASHRTAAARRACNKAG